MAHQHRQSSVLRSRKFVKNTRKISIASIALILSLIVSFSILAYYYLSRDNNELNTFHEQEDETRSESDKVVKFGHGSILNGGDSRYWDRDDRRRDVGYNGDGLDVGEGNGDVFRRGRSSAEVGRIENGRDELKLYEAEFEASMKNVGQSTGGEEGFNDEYYDAIDYLDDGFEDHQDGTSEKENQINVVQEQDDGIGANKAIATDRLKTDSMDGTSHTTDEPKADFNPGNVIKVPSANKTILGRGSNSRRTPKPRRFTGSPCEIKFLNSTAQLVEPSESKNVSRFSLQYTDVEERPTGQEQWNPSFAGHQSLKEREESFYAHDQKINCGFIKGPKGSPSTGFDLEEDDVRFMSSCHIAVSSCIFGNSDKLRSPFGKTVTRLSRKSVCFVMFMDEMTLQTLSSEGQKPDDSGFIGLWKIVVVKNIPFADMRRVGKIPKFLAHRLFPSARYSIWLDSKLRLQRDPLLILEYFLWRKGYEYAITNHYTRHCVWEEVAQNKRLNKFNHSIIDQQFLFYQADGLKRFNASDPNKFLPSNVPEGSFIVRAHTPMSNLFCCLWYNEVDRFTPRDQLSFAYVYHKLRRMNPEKPFRFKMFKDCERRAIAKLFHHRGEEKPEKRNNSSQAMK